MYVNKNAASQSRRQVQRRFAPGTFAVNGQGKLTLVIGWSPVAADINPRTGYVRRAASWEALICANDRIERLGWEVFRDLWTLEEWEAHEA